MKTLTHRLEEYLALRRAMGYSLDSTGRLLGKFTEYADLKGQHTITTSLFLDWKASFGNANPNTWAQRLGMVRMFAIWLAQRDDQTEVPPTQLLPGNQKRNTPYIYSKSEIASIVEEAGKLPSDYGTRGALWRTFFGLVSVTGMRVSEAIKLDNSDVDMKNAVVTVQQGKNNRIRQLPIDQSVVEQLNDYAQLRDQFINTASDRFFLKEDGIPASACGARYNFAQVSMKVGLRSQQRFCRHGHGPRIHDLRHTFAVHTILEWFREERNIEREMYKLSNYLGHTKPKNTYWYIEAIPELMQLAAARSESRLLEERV